MHWLVIETICSTGLQLLALVKWRYSFRGARVGHWCEHRPPNNVAGFKSQHRSHMWVEFVFGFFLCSGRFFSGYSGFPLSSKNQPFQIPIRPGMVNREPLCGCALSKSLFIYRLRLGDYSPIFTSPEATNCFSMITLMIIRENKIIDQFPTTKHQKNWLPFWKLLAFNVIITARWL